MEGFKKPTKGMKIVCGFNGNIDSVVSAYLLKRQGFDVIGLGITFTSKAAEDLPQRYDENGDRIPRAPFQGIYNIDDLEEVKKLADALGILFYAVDASMEYKDRVTDFVVGSRVGGRSFSPKVNASSLMFSVLKKKAKVLGAQFIATGHYAKIVRNQSTQTSNIFVSHDLINDQSYLLANLHESILSYVKLPLSDMRKSEVEKIGKELKLKFLEHENTTAFMDREGIGNFIADRMPPKMIKAGHMIDFRNDSFICEHSGIHNFALGRKNIRIPGGPLIDKNYMVIGFKYAAGIVYIGMEEDLEYDMILLSDVYYPDGTDLSRPLEVHIKTREKAPLKAAYIYFLNNNYAKLEFKEKYKGMVPQGEYIAFYNHSGTTGKIIGSGTVRSCGLIENGKWRSFPKKKDEIEDEDSEVIDIYKFKF